MSDFEAGRKAGEQAATIESLEQRITALEGKVDQVLERVTMARGGIYVLAAIGSAATAVLGFFLAVWLHGR